jgi:hypothetical protein
MGYICKPFAKTMFFKPVCFKPHQNSDLEINRIFFENKFGDSEIKRLSLHPLLTSSCS